MIKVGLYFGSFNPLHVGHMAVAEYAMSEAKLDQLWFVPSPQNPLKEVSDFLTYDERCQMIRDAIKGKDNFCLTTIEEDLPSPNYTVQTLHALSLLYSQCEFYLIIGADNWASFDAWYGYRRILLRWKLIIYPRSGFTVSEDTLPQGSIYLAGAPEIDVSSSEIREAIKSQKDLRHKLPNPANWENL